MPFHEDLLLKMIEIDQSEIWMNIRSIIRLSDIDPYLLKLYHQWIYKVSIFWW